MVTLKGWLEAIDYKITEGSEYGWDCYGSAAYSLDYWDQDHDGVSSSVTFSRTDQTVYECYVCDYSKNKYYRWIHPDYQLANEQEGKDRGHDSDIVFDDEKFTELEVEEDFLEKLKAIVNYQPYDTRIQVPLDLNKKDMLTLMKQAHEADLTLNQYVERLLRRVVDEHGQVLYELDDGPLTDEQYDKIKELTKDKVKTKKKTKKWRG